MWENKTNHEWLLRDYFMLDDLSVITMNYQ
jgi:hypothetical protein